MDRDINNAKRLLAMIEILEQYTDEEHELSVRGIMDKLKLKFGSDYEVSKNTIKNNINELIDYGIHIESSVKENNTIYYRYMDRKFEIYQLRMLIDAVASAKFLTVDETNQLIAKIKSLTSRNLAKKLGSHIWVSPSLKAASNEVRYIIDNIHTAINENRKISFQYGKYNVRKEFVLRNNGQRYVVEPLNLVWHHEFYYLAAIHNGETKHFRIDRMRKIKILEESFKKPDFDLEAHMKNSFHMFTGEPEYVEIQVSSSLINTMLNHFGLDVPIIRYDDHTFTIKTKVYINEGSIRWLLTWGSDVKVISPQHLIDQIREEIRKMQKIYE